MRRADGYKAFEDDAMSLSARLFRRGGFQESGVIIPAYLFRFLS